MEVLGNTVSESKYGTLTVAGGTATRPDAVHGPQRSGIPQKSVRRISISSIPKARLFPRPQCPSSESRLVLQSVNQG